MPHILDTNTKYLPPPWGYYRLTLSQFASAAGEQEPLYPDDEDVEEILMRLRHGHDYYRPQAATPPPAFPLLFPPHSQMRPQAAYHYEHSRVLPHPASHPHSKGSLFHILAQEPQHHQEPIAIHHHHHNHHSHHSQLNINNNIQMRKLFFEDGLVESSDEQDLEHPKKKARRDQQGKIKSPLKSIVVSSNDDVQEKETVAAGLCFKTHKPKVQREYYYAKLSKTIFRWTCCGSQAKTHPDA